MTNIIKIDTSMINDNNILLNKLNYERTKLELVDQASPHWPSLLSIENFWQQSEFLKSALNPKPTVSSTNSSISVGSKFRGMAEKWKISHQQSLSSSESKANRMAVLEVNSDSNTQTDNLESLDYSSPTGIKDLLTSAEGLLSRLQNAYIQRTSELNDTIISRDSLAEDLEESNTRADNLRSQLEQLANTINSKDQRIIELEREILESKANPYLNQSSHLNCQELQSCSAIPHYYSTLEHLGSTSEENSCYNSISNDLDMANESDCDSSTFDGVFSRPRSPALTNSSSIMSRSPHVRSGSYSSLSPSLLGPMNKNTVSYEKPKPQPQKSFFSFLSGRPSNKDLTLSKQDGCTNCTGSDTNTAWDTVRLLRAENKGLKGRIVELEDAVNETLDAVQGYF